MLSTLPAVKTHLGIASSDTTEDAALAQWLPQVDALIKSWCRQALEQASYTEYPDGDGTDTVVLRQGPVTAVAGVWLDAAGAYGQAAGAFGSATQLVAGVDYALRIDQPDGVTAKARRLVRLNGVWPGARQYTAGLLYPALIPGRGCIKVQYTAGYATVPADLALACNQAVAVVRQLRAGKFLQSENEPDYTYAALTPTEADAVIQAVRGRLAPYRSLRL